MGEDTTAAYMARRALGLLLTRGALSGDSIVRFELESGDAVAAAHQRPALRRVLHLLNTLLALRGFFEGVLPFLEERHHWVDSGVRGEGEAIADGRPGKIDWTATFSHFAEGGEEVQLKSRRRVRIESDDRYLALVLAELTNHGRELSARFHREAVPLAAPLKEMLEELDRRLARIADLLKMPRFGELHPAESTLHRLGELYAEDLDRPGSRLFGEYRERSDGLAGCGSRVYVVSEVTKRLRAWRDQYLAGEVWLTDKAGLDLATGHAAGLYELWCFAEFLRAAESLGLGELSQTAFLCRGSGEAVFDWGAQRYAYYDFDASTFRSVRADQLFAGTEISTPALPGARVEWLVRYGDAPRDSLILDTKYHRQWDSGEALKVLGYMQNYGVKQGAVIFPCPLDTLEGWRQPVQQNLFQCPCPDSEGAVLWILRLIPEPAAEAANRRVLEAFLRRAILG